VHYSEGFRNPQYNVVDFAVCSAIEIPGHDRASPRAGCAFVGRAGRNAPIFPVWYCLSQHGCDADSRAQPDRSRLRHDTINPWTRMQFASDA
jgi:hypothetical protein